MMPAGEYYIGDLCYVMHGEWSEVCDLTIKYETDDCLDGEFALADGRRFAMYRTTWGDGEYEDQHGKSYPVDAGLIGCIRVSDIDMDNLDNDITLGNVYTFDKDFNTFSEEGKICIGGVIVDTDPIYEEYDEEYDEPEVE